MRRLGSTLNLLLSSSVWGKPFPHIQFTRFLTDGMVPSGAKGVLSDWSQLVNEYEIRLRPSMIKFKSDLADLNVIRVNPYTSHSFSCRYIADDVCALPDCQVSSRLFESTVYQYHVRQRCTP